MGQQHTKKQPHDDKNKPSSAEDDIITNNIENDDQVDDLQQIENLENVNEENIEKFIPKDVLIEMCVNYLEISEMFELALTCKVFYSWLFCNDKLLWERFARRDGIQLQSGKCKQFYKNIFENIQNLLKSDDFEKERYVFQMNISPSSIIFTKNFIPKLNLNDLVYILRNTKINIIVRANVIMNGLGKFPVNEDYIEKLKTVFLNACALEDGKRFTFVERYTSSQLTILTILFKYRYNELGKYTPLIDDLLLSKVLYGSDCSGIPMKDTLVFKAINIMLKDYKKDPTLHNDRTFAVCQYYWNLVAEDKIGNIQALEVFNIFQSFSESRKEQVVETIEKLLKNNTDGFDNNPLSKTVSAFIIEHLTVFDMIDEVNKYSRQYHYYCYRYFEKIIKSKQLSIELKQKALDYLLEIFKEQKDKQISLIRPQYFYYTFELIRNNEYLLNEKHRIYYNNVLENEMFNAWAESKEVPPPDYLRMLSGVNLKRTVDSLLISNPITYMIEPCYLSEERGIAVFETFERYSNEICQDLESETFFAKLIPVLDIVFGHENNNDDITDRMIYKNIIRWMKPKYSKGAEAMIKYIKNQDYYLPLIEKI